MESLQKTASKVFSAYGSGLLASITLKLALADKPSISASLVPVSTPAHAASDSVIIIFGECVCVCLCVVVVVVAGVR